MKCTDCRINMRKVDLRNEIAEPDDDATEGQMADYFAAELSGDNGAWNLGIIEYSCPKCKRIIYLQGDELPSYASLIESWHAKANDDDPFTNFVFEYLAFIAHIKNNLYYFVDSDRLAIQILKSDGRIEQNYLTAVRSTPELNEAWSRITEELRRKPLHNSSHDPDFPEIDKWWNGVIQSLDDWPNMVEFWYGVRNNLFHGGKNPNLQRDIFLVQHAYFTLRSLMEAEIAAGHHSRPQ
jgi:hypothetical protein